MSEIATRLILLLGLGILTWLVVLVGRHFVEKRRRQALAAAPLAILPTTEDGTTTTNTRVRILAFSSENCQQCKRLQAPTLERVLEARGEAVTITLVDATTEHDLTQKYRVLTIPSTVVLDAEGHARAINYGFANMQLLLSQIDDFSTLKRVKKEH